MIDIVTFKDKNYPKFQSEGFASKFAFPFADQICKGEGLDIGCNRLDWMLPNIPNVRKVSPIDPALNQLSAINLNVLVESQDFIFSSHCLEHIPDWINVLDYWTSKIKKGGVLFLYLPDFSQHYWRPWHNRKHLHVFTPEIINEYLQEHGQFTNIYVSGIDLNNSFMAIAEKI